MIRLSKLSDYAVVVLECLARDGACVVSAADIAAQSRVPEPTVAKVLKLLSSAGLVASSRGANGGYQMARTIDAISVQDIIAAIEGDIVLTACADESDDSEPCALHGHCALTGRWRAVNAAVKAALSGVTLAQMVRGK